MELWSRGSDIAPLRLALLWALTMPLLARLSRFGGLRETDTVADDIADALVAIVSAAAASVLLLWLFGVLNADLANHELVGRVAIQAIPGSLGAILALNQFGGSAREQDRAKAEQSYGGELFLMLVGALFLSFNIAPTEEVMLIAYQMSSWQTLGLVAVSLAVMHAFVYVVEFHGSHRPEAEDTLLGLFARFTVVGYVIVLAVCTYVLWTFGKIEGLSVEDLVGTAVVLGFPASIGAAAARLIL